MHLPATWGKTLTLAAILSIAAPCARAQGKTDWDSAAASLIVSLLTSEHVTHPAAEKDKKLTIAIVGGNRFGRAMAAIAAGKKTHAPVSAPFDVMTVADKDVIERKDEWSRCHVIVFATDDAKVQTQVLAIMAGRSSMLIGRTKGFVAAGGHMNVWLSDDQKPRYELDLQALRKAGVKLSSAVVKSSKKEPEGEVR